MKWRTEDKAFFLKKGFEVCDTAPPFFELLVKKFKKDAPSPRFKDSVRAATCADKKGLTFIYSHQCPFTECYADLMVDVARAHNLSVKKVVLKTKREAQSAPLAFTIFSVFYKGDFLTHKMMSKDGFEKFLKKSKIIT